MRVPAAPVQRTAVSVARNAAFRAAVPVLLSVLFALSVPGLAAADPGLPPDAVLDRLDAALGLLGTTTVSSTFVMTTRLELSDGKGNLTRWFEQCDSVATTPGKPPETTMLWRKGGKAGKDEADAGTSASASRAPGASGDGSAWKFVVPSRETRRYFDFAVQSWEGPVLSVAYQPVASLPKDAPKGKLTRGTLAWDSRGDVPLRFAMEPVRMPPFTSRLALSYEFATSGGFSYPRTIATSGEASILFSRTIFSSLTTFTEFTLRKAP